MDISPIAYIQNDYVSKFGIPRQSNIVKEQVSKIVFMPKYRNKDALRGIEGYDYIWLIWGFDTNVSNQFIPTVRPPKLGGNTKMGVFATRSPFRPNSLGLSSVQLIKVEDTEAQGSVLFVKGADLMNGTKIYDIKPYIPVSDSHPNAAAGFTEAIAYTALKVEFSPQCNTMDATTKAIIADIISNDPRPQYQSDEERVYGMEYGAYEIRFSVKADTAYVSSIELT